MDILGTDYDRDQKEVQKTVNKDNLKKEWVNSIYNLFAEASMP